MNARHIFSAFWMVALVLGVTAEARVWTDSTGMYTLEADLVGINEKYVVLKRADHDMVALPLETLSEKDREFLKSKEATDQARLMAEGLQTWNLRDGTKFVGRVVDYAQGDVVIQRRRGAIYVNDRRLDNLPAFYQQLVIAFVAQAEKLDSADRRALDAWVLRQRGAPRTFDVQGVLIQVENGDEYAIPFSLFTDADLKMLKPGWDAWAAARQAKDYGTLDDTAFLLQYLIAARQHDADIQREIALMQLKLNAVQAGVTSLWEVTLYPAAGRRGPPLWVVVTGRDSRQASINAMEMNPGFVVGPVRRVSN